MATLYFYVQHYKIVKKSNINQKIVFGDVIIDVRELTIENFKPRVDYDPPWYYGFVRKLPLPIQVPFFKVCIFYSRPYDFNNEFGTIRLTGLLITKPDALSTEYPNIRDAFDIYIRGGDERFYSRSFGTLHHKSSNYFPFKVEDENAPFANGEYTVFVKDKRNDDIRSLTVRPEWEIETYTYFDGTPAKYEFDPAKTAEKFLSLMRRGKIEEARNLVIPGPKEKSAWSRLDHQYWRMDGNDYVLFEGSHLGYEDVYSVNVAFGRRETEKQGDLIPVAEQKIYFIDQNGSPVVIDAYPVTVLSKRR